MSPEQRLFNEAWTHILKQGEPSVLSNGSNRCQYRNGELGCAFAPAIKNYDPVLEGMSASDLLERYHNNLFPWVQGVSTSFADALQNCHDFASGFASDEFIELFKSNMVELAEETGLEVPA